MTSRIARSRLIPATLSAILFTTALSAHAFTGQPAQGQDRTFTQDTRLGDQTLDRREGWDRDVHRASDRGPSSFGFSSHNDLHRANTMHFAKQPKHHPFAVTNHGSRYR